MCIVSRQKEKYSHTRILRYLENHKFIELIFIYSKQLSTKNHLYNSCVLLFRYFFTTRLTSQSKIFSSICTTAAAMCE